MLKVLLTPALCGAATVVAAQGRPSTLAMSCAQARALIQWQGAIVLSTGPYTYDRFVRDQGFCPLAEVAEQTWEPTADVLYSLCLRGEDDDYSADPGD